jgi:hypothetical protein
MREEFKEVRFTPASSQRIEQCNSIISNYQAQHLRLTLRQLYYQMVVRNWLVNEERSYRQLSGLISDARLAGLVDWDAIEDRVRVPRIPTEFTNLRELTEAALQSYRLPRWVGQKHYVELWVEKDALAGVLIPLARHFHVTLMVNRGYSSQSAMYESANRFREKSAILEDNSNLIIFYLGDHDPSGEDMVRDIRDRLFMFGMDIDVRKIALTMEQIEHYNPPPNPTKLTDSRAPAYIAMHGNNSWEVDALPPEVLTGLITSELNAVINKRDMNVVKALEERDKKNLRVVVEGLLNSKPKKLSKPRKPKKK